MSIDVYIMYMTVHYSIHSIDVYIYMPYAYLNSSYTIRLPMPMK